LIACYYHQIYQDALSGLMHKMMYVHIEKEVTVQYVLHICYDIQNETQKVKLYSQNVFKQNIFLNILFKQAVFNILQKSDI